ncbi:MAG: response regulator [Bacteroidia bacterium]
MKKGLLYIVLLSVFFSCANQLKAQSIKYSISSFGLNNGLSSPQIFDVELDSRSLIWCATKYGLNRFDGVNFKAFYEADGLYDNKVDQLFFDGKLLWCLHIETSKGSRRSISLFDPVKEKFKTLSSVLPFEYENEPQITNIKKWEEGVVFSLLISGEKHWFSVNKKGKINQYTFINNEKEILGLTRNSNIWIREKKEGWEHIVKRDIKGNLITSVPFHEKLPGLVFRCFYDYDNGNNLFVGFEKWFSIVDGKIEFLNLRAKVPISENKNIAINSFDHNYWEEKDLYWYSYKNDLALFDRNENIIFSTENQINHAWPQVEFIGNTIIQCTGQGLKVIRVDASPFKTLLKDSSKYGFRGMSQNADHIYFTSYGGTYQFTEITENLKKINNAGFNVACQGEKELIYSNRGHFFKQNLTNFSIKKLDDAGSYETWSLFIDSKGKVWSSGDGIQNYDLNTQKYSEFFDSNYPELSNAIVYNITEGPNQKLYICSAAGLYILDSKQNKIIARYCSELKGSNYLPAIDVRHIYFNDNNKSVWIATNGKGIIYWDFTTGEYQQFVSNNNLTQTIHCVYGFTNHPYLWLSTNYGIQSFNTETNEFKTYLEADGISSNEFNRISHLKSKNGLLYFGSINGITYFNPDNVRAFKPNQRFNIALVDAHEFKNSKNDLARITENVLETQLLRLSNEERFIDLKFGVSDLSLGVFTKYEYKLNQNDNWIQMAANNLNLAGIPYGDYNLTVRAKDPKGNLSANELYYKLRVIKPIYLRWQFWLLIICLTALSTLLLVKRRTQKLENQKVELEKMVSERTLTIEKQANELKSLDKQKTKFFANVSHELRTPLTLVLGPLEKIISQDEVTLPTLVEQNVNRSLRSVKTLQSMVNEILDLTKLESKKLELSFKDILLEPVLRAAFFAFEPIAEQRDIHLEFKSLIQPDIVVRADEDKLQKVVRNLVANAIKFSKSNAQIKIELGKTESDHFYFKVIDQGIGISADEHKRIFERYYQSKDGKAQGGTGIGLAFCKEIALLMHGDLVVESQKAKGSSFIFSFKATQISKEQARLQSENDNLDHSDLVSLSSIVIPKELTVLVVEDNFELRKYIVSILDSHFKIIEASNGVEALSVLEKRKVDLITSDVMMPEMDGMELLGRIKQHEEWRAIPTIMLTAKSNKADKIDAFKIGIDDYITKPFLARELTARVGNVLQNLKIRRAAVKELKEQDHVQQNLVAQIQNFVLNRLTEGKITVADVAMAVGQSERSLLRSVKAECGLTVNNLIKEIRLTQARDFFEERRFETVQEIMYATGFKSHAHFAKDFHKRFGKKPNEYFL